MSESLPEHIRWRTWAGSDRYKLFMDKAEKIIEQDQKDFFKKEMTDQEAAVARKRVKYAREFLDKLIHYIRIESSEPKGQTNVRRT